MKVIELYLRIYADCWRRTFGAIRKNPWTLLLPPAILFARDAVGRLALGLGVLGGLVIGLATAALFSSYLHFVGELVHGGRASARELQRSLGAYLWPLVNTFFVVWLASLVVGIVLGGRPSTAAVLYALWLVSVVALNVVPEVIYIRGTHGGLQTIALNWEFIQAQWIPWFAVNVPLFCAVAFVAILVPVPIVATVLVGFAIHLAMVFRGNLFRALDRSTHRQRMFAQRVA